MGIILSCKMGVQNLSIFLYFSLVISSYFQFLYYTTHFVYSPSKCVEPKFSQIRHGFVVYLSLGKGR